MRLLPPNSAGLATATVFIAPTTALSLPPCAAPSPPSLPRQPPRHPASTAEPHSHRWGAAGRGGQCGDTPGHPVSPRTASARQHRPGSARAPDWLVLPTAQPMGWHGSAAIHENPAGSGSGSRSRRSSVPGASLRAALGTGATG